MVLWIKVYAVDRGEISTALKCRARKYFLKAEKPILMMWLFWRCFLGFITVQHEHQLGVYGEDRSDIHSHTFAC